MGKQCKKKRGTIKGAETKPSGRYGTIISLLLIAIITLLIYSNTFYSPFYFDDYNRIKNNYMLRDLTNFWPPSLLSDSRYMGYLSLAINYYFGGLDVFGYHLVNVTSIRTTT